MFALNYVVMPTRSSFCYTDVHSSALAIVGADTLIFDPIFVIRKTTPN